MRRSPALLLALLVLLEAAPGAAFSVSRTEWGQYMRWTTRSVGYYLGADGSDDITNGSELQAIRDSFADWQNISCAFLTFEELGTTTVRDVIPTGAEGNGRNELVWVETSDWPFGVYTLGVTSPLAYVNGQIVEADIAFNGYLQQWSTSNSPGDRMDVKSVAIHEIGHLFGLQHNLYPDWDDPETMAPTVDPYLRTRTLSDDDEMGICFLYPDAGTYTCRSNGECPYILDVNANSGDEYYVEKLTCQSGTCAGQGGTQPGDAQLGEACESGGDCAQPYFCQPSPNGGSFCSETCDPTGADCPAGLVCYPFSNSSDGACLPSGGPVPQPAGSPCASAYDCTTYFCVANPVGGEKVCREICRIDAPACAAGLECFPMSGNTGACIPDALVPDTPKRPVGEACTQSFECETSLCVLTPGGSARLCRRPCTPGSDECGAAETCFDVGGGRGACLPYEGSLLKDDGVVCWAHVECRSGLCHALPGGSQSQCRTPCNLLAPGDCPDGEACVSYAGTQEGVCMARRGDLGTACSGALDCTTGLCASGGTCTSLCVLGECPCGFACAADGGLGDVCLPDPTHGCLGSGATCADGTQCASTHCLGGICRAACDLFGAVCGQGEGCLHVGDEGAGACVTRGQLGAGTPCASDYQCASLLCNAPAAGAAEVCLAACDDLGATCPTGGTCRNIPGYAALAACVTAGMLPPDGPGGPDAGPTAGGDTTGEVVTPPLVEDGAGGGCHTGAPSGGAALPLLLVALSAILARMRRARRA